MTPTDAANLIRTLKFFDARTSYFYWDVLSKIKFLNRALYKTLVKEDRERLHFFNFIFTSLSFRCLSRSMAIFLNSYFLLASYKCRPVFPVHSVVQTTVLLPIHSVAQTCYLDKRVRKGTKKNQNKKQNKTSN